jgi:hypothetical protein
MTDIREVVTECLKRCDSEGHKKKSDDTEKGMNAE